MPSPLAHGSLVVLVRAVALRHARLHRSLPERPRFLLAAALAALWAPDLDFALRVVSDHPLLAHGGATHSLAGGACIGVLFACACCVFYGRSVPFVPLLCIGVACGWSHSLMDLATWGGRGVMILWPFTDERFSTWPLFFGAHRSEPWAWHLHFATLLTELLFGAVVWHVARRLSRLRAKRAVTSVCCRG